MRISGLLSERGSKPDGSTTHAAPRRVAHVERQFDTKLWRKFKTVAFRRLQLRKWEGSSSKEDPQEQHIGVSWQGGNPRRNRTHILHISSLSLSLGVIGKILSQSPEVSDELDTMTACCIGSYACKVFIRASERVLDNADEAVCCKDAMDNNAASCSRISRQCR